MYKIFLTKEAQDRLTGPDLYLLIQTLRISNSIKMFVLIADDISKKGPDDFVNTQKFMELLLYHAGNLHEILIALRDDLFPRYRATISEPKILADLLRWEDQIRAKGEAVKMLEIIRNKHAFHVPIDPYFVWHTINEGPANDDVAIGLGETMQGSGFFFTYDVDMLFDYLRKHVLQGSITDLGESYSRVKGIIDDVSSDLYKMFLGITECLLRGKIRMEGNKEEARREYGKPV